MATQDVFQIGALTTAVAQCQRRGRLRSHLPWIGQSRSSSPGAHQTDIGDALELVTLIGCRNSVGEDQSVVVRGAP